MSDTSFTIKKFPSELYHKFKVRCAEKGISMKEALIKLVRQFVEGK